MGHIFNKMHGGFESQMNTQNKVEWQNSNPLVEDQMEMVKCSNKRKRIASTSLSLCNELKEYVKIEHQLARTKHVDILKTLLDI